MDNSTPTWFEKNLREVTFKIEGICRREGEEWMPDLFATLLVNQNWCPRWNFYHSRTRFFIFGENLNFRSTVNQFRQPSLPSYWQFRNNFLQETETEKCQEPIKWLNEQSNVGIKKMNYLFIGILKSKGGITFLLFLLPLCSQPIYTLPTPPTQKMKQKLMISCCSQNCRVLTCCVFCGCLFKGAATNNDNGQIMCAAWT